METELMRIGISLPDTLLGKFDEAIEKKRIFFPLRRYKRCYPELYFQLRIDE